MTALRLRKSFHTPCIQLCVFICLTILVSNTAFGTYVPWDTLVSDNWVWTEANPEGIPQVNLYTLNGGYNSGVYPILFEPRKSSDGSAKGMNALKFQYDGANTGHLGSNNLTDSFELLNTGDHNIFDYVVLGIAIQAASLPQDFSMSLDIIAANSWSTTAETDFVYYDATGNDTGRPSGFYSQTDPAYDPLAYDFNAGMTCLVDTGAVLNPNGGSITINYSLNNLPGRVIFSAYGLVSSENPPSIHHTNRSVVDNNKPSAALSTFEVYLPGDVNGDSFVGGTDLNTIISNWGLAGAARWQGDLTGEGDVGGADYNEVLSHWGDGTAPEPAEPMNVPEPTTVVLLLLAGSGLFCRSRVK